MAKYDTESLLADVKAVLVANLNTKIAAIEAEKIASGAPATGLLSVDANNGYFEQSWSDKILNINPAIFFGIEDIKAQGVGPSTIETYRIFVEVILIDSGQDALAKNRIHRYARALKEVFEEKFDQFNNGVKIKVETVRPASFKLDENSSEEMKVGGVSILTAIAS